MGKKNKPLKIFAFIRKDLKLADQLVQLGHGCVLAGEAYRPPLRTHLIVCQVKDMDALLDISTFLEMKEVRFQVFYEHANASREALEWTCVTTEPTDKLDRINNFTLWTAPKSCAILEKLLFKLRKLSSQFLLIAKSEKR